jgi:hypothetical protein
MIKYVISKIILHIRIILSRINEYCTTAIRPLINAKVSTITAYITVYTIIPLGFIVYGFPDKNMSISTHETMIAKNARSEAVTSQNLPSSDKKVKYIDAANISKTAYNSIAPVRDDTALYIGSPLLTTLRIYNVAIEVHTIMIKIYEKFVTITEAPAIILFSY